MQLSVTVSTKEQAFCCLLYGIMFIYENESIKM